MTVMQPVLQPAMVIEDFDWQNKYLIAPLRNSVLYLKKIGEAGDNTSDLSTVFMSDVHDLSRSFHLPLGSSGCT